MNAEQMQEYNKQLEILAYKVIASEPDYKKAYLATCPDCHLVFVAYKDQGKCIDCQFVANDGVSKRAAEQHQYYLANKERILQARKEWVAKNRDKVREYQKNYIYVKRAKTKEVVNNVACG